MKRYILGVMLLSALTTVVSCDKELDLANKYDNSESSVVPDVNQEYNDGNFTDFGWVLMGDPYIVSVTASIPRKGYIPDGKISTYYDESIGKYITYIGADDTLRVLSDTPDIEDYINTVTEECEVKGVGAKDGLDDGGAWFIGVFPLDDGRLVAFYHAESHWAGDGTGYAYKSIAVTYSSDNGVTWSEGERIISSDEAKPADPAWTGLGDACVIYNATLGKFICYYSGNDGVNYRISMAASDDPTGAPGSWKKWDGSDFTVEGCSTTTGIGGANTSIAGLISVAGANPSVMWNTYLEKWLITYYSWDKSAYISTSSDGLTWDAPTLLIASSDEYANYPNLMGAEGDLEGGQMIDLYYSSNMGTYGIRDIAVRRLILTK